MRPCMGDDWQDWFRSRSTPETFADMNAPAGGAGSGYSRLQGDDRCSWSTSWLPHPDSPAGRVLNWQMERWRIERQEREELASEIKNIETLLAERSDKLRESLPNNYLRV